MIVNSIVLLEKITNNILDDESNEIVSTEHFQRVALKDINGNTITEFDFKIDSLDIDVTENDVLNNTKISLGVTNIVV